MDEAMKLANKIAKGPLNCYSASKALMNKAHETTFAQLLDEETGSKLKSLIQRISEL
jgi:enoyl-CoA hydratase/carnithine racemase